MKKWILAVLLVLLFAVPAIADNTGRGNYTTPVNGFTNFMNTNDKFYHNHEYDKYDRDNPIGVGVDLVLLETDGVLESVEVQNKYDFANKEYSGFVVGQFNLFRLLSKGE